MRLAAKLCTLLFFLVLLTMYSCKDGPTGPTDPRKYTWTATQLVYPGASTLMYSIWGSSPSNVYACGFSFLSGNQGALWHFDGQQWSPVTSLPSPDYNFFTELTGFSNNDVWVVGTRLFVEPTDSAVALHFNGSNWIQTLPSHMGSRGLQAVGGISPQNLFFGSKDGKIIHYNGTSYSTDILHDSLGITAIGGDEDLVFAMGNTTKGTFEDSIMCFKRTGTTWDLVDAQHFTESPRFGPNSIYTPAPGAYYSCGYLGVFRWEDNEWVRIFNPTATLWGLGGSGPSNIFVVGWADRPAVYHWDGASWDEIVLPQGIIPGDVELYAVWTNGKEAFIVGGNGATSYVLRGK